MRWHPDKAGPSQREAHARAFDHISRAYTILSNPLERRIYDNIGEEGVQRWRDGDPTAHPDHKDGVFDKSAPVVVSAAPGWDLMDEGMSSMFAFLERCMMQMRRQRGGHAGTERARVRSETKSNGRNKKKLSLLEKLDSLQILILALLPLCLALALYILYITI